MELREKIVAQIECPLGIGQGCPYRWRVGSEAGGQQAFRGQGRLSPERYELRRLTWENETLRRMRDILRKSSGQLLASTVLDLAGYDSSSAMKGRSLLAGRMPAAAMNTGLTVDEEEILRERLSGLGYIS